MKFEDIRAEALVDMKIDKHNLDEESLKIPNLLEKWLEYYRTEKLLLFSYEANCNILYKKRWEFYLGKSTDENSEEEYQKRVLPTNVSIYLDADEKLIQARKIVNQQSEKVKYIEKIIKHLESRQYNIKNAIEWIKWTTGIPG